MKKLMTLIAAGVMAIVPVTAFARGVVVVRGPVFAGGYYGSYWGPEYGPYGYVNQYAGTGEVKLDTKTNDADVFINGAFAGRTKDIKTMHLRPGAYNIEVRHPGVARFNERIYVVAGKTLHLHPAL